MATTSDDATPAPILARCVFDWERRDGAVVLRLEGVDADGATQEAALTVRVLESGAVRLTLGEPAGPPLDPEPDLAPLAVTTSESSLHLASERHARYGPDPEDVAVEVGIEPFSLAVVDAGGRQVARLAEPALAWTLSGGDDPGSASISFALEADERIYGLDAEPGPLDRVGTRRSLDPISTLPRQPSERPPGHFLLSGRGHGLFVHSAARLTADLGASSPAALTLTLDGPTLDLFLFPATWPRTALAACANLIGRDPLPPEQAFGVLASPGPDAAPAEADALAERLRTESIPFDMLPPSDGVAPAPPLPLRESGSGGEGRSADQMRAALQSSVAFGLAMPGRSRHETSPPPPGSPALFERWAQQRLFGQFAHVPMAPGAAPWDAGEPALANFRAYAELRYRLLPYLLHCARETADLGLPMLRPLVLEFSWDATAATIDDQYLLGRDLLVAPVFSDEAGPVERRVYLPAYANWYDWWTGRLLEGGQWVEQAVPLEQLPLYVRAGTAIPLADPRATIGDQPIEVTRLLLFAPRDGAIGSSVELAEGDMLGVEHERGPERSRIFIEGLPATVRDLEIVGLPPAVEIVDAASTRVRIVPGDASLPGLGGDWASVTIALDVGAYTTGLELRW